MVDISRIDKRHEADIAHIIAKESHIEEVDAEVISRINVELSKEDPAIIFCAFNQGPLSTGGNTITFSSLTSSYTNSGKPGGGDGELNIQNGVFTCKTSGYYIQ